ncbi:large subunit ribosomal protein L23 [Metamycoplasma subdolum]|uniref:Large ribosomal subunit protein uL23 n=1 Tax=Metamycoplasma subdolum TaxID=92407 RepID=A0A3M0A1R0_9BACT|nr:50S ribosomal protein L23 [Metamycoplasma subdolum]RMA78576.1 large subunit ribosomal protein L23 [Metamycoplasma subdolum]WPB50285.1 50S ribosomal protein L23 [Metamycoplasma subdolum]
MNINEVIKYPISTEKSEMARSGRNIYTFAVDPRANKIQVKKAVEFIFDVKVLKVNITNYDKKPKRLGRSQGFGNALKKAFVYLDEKSKIILYAEEAEELRKQAEKEAKKAKKDAKKGELTEAEKKAAEKIAAAKAKKEESEKSSSKNANEVKKPVAKKIAATKTSTATTKSATTRKIAPKSK